MSVENETAFSGPYTANGVTTVFPFSFVAASADEVEVTLDGDIVSTMDYSVNLSADGTGAVTITPAPASGVIYIDSAPNFRQEVVFERFGPYFPDTLNKPLDRTAIRDLWLKDKIDRAPSAPRDVADVVGKVPVLDADGNWYFTEFAGADGTLRADMAASGGAALVGTPLGSVQTVLNGIAAREGRYLNVLDFISPSLHAGIKSGANTTALHTFIQAAIDQAISEKKTLYIPGGFYKLAGELNTGTIANGNFLQIIGDGWGRTILRASTSAVPMVLTSRYCRIIGIEFDANYLAPHGVVVQDANGSIMEWCYATHATLDGCLFDTEYGGRALGNNNEFEVRSGAYNDNGRCGIWVEADFDNNDLRFTHINASSNTLHGLMAKSEGGVLLGGLFEGNDGYGIQLGESGDVSYTTNWRILSPWLEANGSGGCRGGKSQNNIIDLKNAAQGYTRDAGAGSGDTVLRSTGGGLYRISNDGITSVQFSANTTDAYIVADSTEANVNLNYNAKGTGRHKMNADVDIATGKVFRVNGVQVVGPPGAAVANATDAASVIARLNDLLARLRAHGLIAT